MVTKVREVRKFDGTGKVLIVGLPGMGRVGYMTARHFIDRFNSELVAEVYSTYFPPQLLVDRRGVGEVFVGKLYMSDNFLVFTAETQPGDPVGQNEVCDTLLSYLSSKGIEVVLAGAAYVVPRVGKVRKVFITGNREDLIRKLVGLGGEVLSEGLVSGINGAIVGWATYYGIPAAVVLGETWSAIVELDDIDYRAAAEVVKIMSKFMGVPEDTEYMLRNADLIEERIATALRSVSPPPGRGRGEGSPREVM